MSTKEETLNKLKKEIEERYSPLVHEPPDKLKIYFVVCSECDYLKEDVGCSHYCNCSDTWASRVLYGRCPFLRFVADQIIKGKGTSS